MRAMLLAAGLGTRLRPLTFVRPKILTPIAGVPVLDYWLAQFHAAGFEAVIVNAFHLSDELTAKILGRTWPIPVCVKVEPVLLGTGGGIRNVLDFFDDGQPIVVVNGDIFCKVDWAEILDEYSRSGAPACLIVHDCPPFNNVAVDGNGMILGFGEDAYAMKRTRENVRLLAFTGIHVMDPRILAGLVPGEPADILALYRKLIRNGNPPRMLKPSGLFWREMGSIESYRALHAEIPRLAEGFLPPLTTGRSIWVHGDANVAPDAELKGYVSCGAGTIIPGGVELEDVILWDDVCVEPGSRLSGCIVGDGVTVKGDHRNEVIVNHGK